MPEQDPIEQRIVEIERRLLNWSEREQLADLWSLAPFELRWLITQVREALAALRKAEARLSTYDDCFEQFDVKTLAALVDKYENKLNKAEQERDALLEPPNIEAWKTLVAYAYEMGGDGTRQIQAITSEYVQIRQERDTALIEAKVVESLRNEIPALKQERDKAQRDLHQNRERLDWISCADAEEIEAMLAHTVCDDLEDMCRYIDAAISADKD